MKYSLRLSSGEKKHMTVIGPFREFLSNCNPTTGFGENNDEGRIEAANDPGRIEAEQDLGEDNKDSIDSQQQQFNFRLTPNAKDAIFGAELSVIPSFVKQSIAWPRFSYSLPWAFFFLFSCPCSEVISKAVSVRVLWNKEIRSFRTRIPD